MVFPATTTRQHNFYKSHDSAQDYCEAQNIIVQRMVDHKEGHFITAGTVRATQQTVWAVNTVQSSEWELGQKRVNWYQSLRK